MLFLSHAYLWDEGEDGELTEWLKNISFGFTPVGE
jgi:hypothetical protein